MVATVPAKRGRKPAAATAPATGQVQSLTRGLKLLEWIAESNGSVALTELAQQAGLPNSTTHRLSPNPCWKTVFIAALSPRLIAAAN